MGASIDERVVEMKFDSAQFESGIKDSIKSLDELKQSLDLNTAATKFNSALKVISGIWNVTKGIASTFKNAASSVKNFALQITGLGSLWASQQSKMMGFVSEITGGAIASGFQEYELKMNSVRTIFSNVEKDGKSLNDVADALERLNVYADKTIYNFGEMTRNIGYFTVAGVDLDTSVSAIKGLSNLAALQGVDSSAAARATYQISQALSTGTVRLMDWKSLENAGMAGKGFQEMLISIAKKQGDAYDKAFKKHGSFRESLAEGWLTTDILLQALNMYSGDFGQDMTDQFISSGYAAELYSKALEDGGKTMEKYGLKMEKLSAMTEEERNATIAAAITNLDVAERADETMYYLTHHLGYTVEEAEELYKTMKRANEAAKEVTTFTKLVDAVKEAAQSGWSQSWEIIIGDIEEAKKVWTAVSDEIGGILGRSAERRNAILKDWKEQTAVWGTDEYGNPIITSYKIFDAIANFYQGIKGIAGHVKKIFADTFGTVTANTLVNWTNKLLSLSQSFKDFVYGTEEAPSKLSKLTPFIQRIANVSADVVSTIKSLAGSAFGFIKKLIFSEDFGSALGAIIDLIGGLFNTLKNSHIIEGVFSILQKVAIPVINALLHSISWLINVFGKLTASIRENGVWKSISGWFQKGFDWLGKLAKSIISWFSDSSSINDAVEWLGNASLWIMTRMSNLFSSIKNWFRNSKVIRAIGNAFSWLGAQLRALNFGKLFADIGEWFSDMWNRIRNIDIAGAISKGWGKIKRVFVAAGSVMKRFFSNIWTSIKGFFKSAGNWFSTAASDVWSWLSNVFEGIGQFFVDVGKGIASGITSAYNWIVNAAKKIWTIVKDIGTWIGNAFASVKNFITGLFTKSSKEIKSSGSAMSDSITETGEKTESAFSAFFTKKIPAAVRGFTKFIRTELLPLFKEFASVSMMFNAAKLVGGLGSFAKGLGSAAKNIGRGVKAFGKSAKSFGRAAELFSLHGGVKFKNKFKFNNKKGSFLSGNSIFRNEDYTKTIKHVDSWPSAILKLSASLMLVVAAIKVISKIPADEFWAGAARIGIIMAGLIAFTGVFALLSKISGFEPGEVGKSLLKTSIAIAALAGCIYLFDTIDWATFANGLGKITLMLAALGLITSLMARFGKTKKRIMRYNGNESTDYEEVFAPFGKIANAMIKLAAAAVILSKANVDWNSIGMLSAMMAALMGVIIGISRLAQNKKDTKDIVDLVKPMKALASVIMRFAVIAVLLGAINMETAIQGVSSIVVLLAALMGAMIGLVRLTAINKDTKDISDLIKPLKALSKIMTRLAVLTVMLGMISMETAIQGVSSLVVLMGMLVGAMALMTKISNTSKGNFRAVAAMKQLVKMMTPLAIIAVVLGSLNLATAIQGIASVVVLLASLGGFMMMTSKWGKNLNKNSYLVIISVIGYLATIALMAKSLSNMSIDDLVKGFAPIIAMMAMLAVTIKQASKIDTKSGLTSIGLIASIAGFLVLVVASIYQLSSLDLKKTAVSAGSLAAIFAALAAVLSQASEMNIKSGTGALIGLAGVAVAIVAAGFAIRLIAKFKPGSILAAAGSISAIVGVCGLLTALFTKVEVEPKQVAKGAAGLAILIGVITGIVAILGLLAVNFSGFEKVLVKGSQMLAVIGQSIGGFFAGIASVFDGKKWYEMLLILGVMAGIGAAFCVIGPVGVVRIVAGLAIIIAAFATLAALLGKLQEYFDLAGLLDTGMTLIAKIGEIIGRFFGGVVSGFSAQSLSTLGEIGAYLSEFAKAIEPFLTNFLPKFDSVDLSTLTKFGAFASAINDLAGASLENQGAGLFSYSGGSVAIGGYYKAVKQDFEAYSRGVVGILGSMQTFIESTSKLTPAQLENLDRALFISKRLMVELREFEAPFKSFTSAGLFGTNGQTVNILGYSKDVRQSFLEYSTGISQIVSSMTEFVEATKGLTSEELSSIEGSIPIVRQLVGVLQKFEPVEEEFTFAGLFGTNGQDVAIAGYLNDVKGSFKDYGESLSGITTSITSFITSCSGLTEDQIESIGGILPVVQSLVTTVSSWKSPGLSFEFAGLFGTDSAGDVVIAGSMSKVNESFSSYATGLNGIVSSVSSFVSNTANLTEAQVESVNRVLPLVGDLIATLYNYSGPQLSGESSSFWGLFSEKSENESFSSFSSGVSNLLTSITTLATEAGKLADEGVVSEAIGALQQTLDDVANFLNNVINGLTLPEISVETKDFDAYFKQAKEPFNNIATGISSLLITVNTLIPTLAGLTNSSATIERLNEVLTSISTFVHDTTTGIELPEVFREEYSEENDNGKKIIDKLTSAKGTYGEYSTAITNVMGEVSSLIATISQYESVVSTGSDGKSELQRLLESIAVFVKNTAELDLSTIYTKEELAATSETSGGTKTTLSKIIETANTSYTDLGTGLPAIMDSVGKLMELFNKEGDYAGKLEGWLASSPDLGGESILSSILGNVSEFLKMVATVELPTLSESITKAAMTVDGGTISVLSSNITSLNTTFSDITGNLPALISTLSDMIGKFTESGEDSASIREGLRNLVSDNILSDILTILSTFLQEVFTIEIPVKDVKSSYSKANGAEWTSQTLEQLGTDASGILNALTSFLPVITAMITNLTNEVGYTDFGGVERTTSRIEAIKQHLDDGSLQSFFDVLYDFLSKLASMQGGLLSERIVETSGGGQWNETTKDITNTFGVNYTNFFTFVNQLTTWLNTDLYPMISGLTGEDVSKIGTVLNGLGTFIKSLSGMLSSDVWLTTKQLVDTIGRVKNGEVVGEDISSMTDGLTSYIGALTKFVGDILYGFGKLTSVLSSTGVLGDAAKAVRLENVLNSFGSFIASVSSIFPYLDALLGDTYTYSNVSGKVDSLFQFLSAFVADLSGYVANTSNQSTLEATYESFGESLGSVVYPSIVKGFKTQLKANEAELHEIGYEVSSLIGEGMLRDENGWMPSADDWYMGDQLTVALQTAIESAIASANSYKNQFYTAGLNFAAGLARGIQGGAGVVRMASATLAGTALATTMLHLKEHSPSKATYQMGFNFDRGLSGGITDYTNIVATASTELANTALNSVSSIGTDMARLLNNAMQADDTIRPVVDLSAAQSGYDRLRSMAMNAAFDMATSRRAAEKNASFNYSFSRQNGDVVDAVNRMAGKIETLSSDMRNMKVVMNSGALVGQIANDMSKKMASMVNTTKRRSAV